MGMEEVISEKWKNGTKDIAQIISKYCHVEWIKK